MQNGLEREWIEKRQVSSPLDKQEIRDRIGDGRGVFILLLVLFFFLFVGSLCTQQKILPSKNLHSTGGRMENKQDKL